MSARGLGWNEARPLLHGIAPAVPFSDDQGAGRERKGAHQSAVRDTNECKEMSTIADFLNCTLSAVFAADIILRIGRVRRTMPDWNL